MRSRTRSRTLARVLTPHDTLDSTPLNFRENEK
jgi:hypothetical protein